VIGPSPTRILDAPRVGPGEAALKPALDALGGEVRERAREVEQKLRADGQHPLPRARSAGLPPVRESDDLAHALSPRFAGNPVSWRPRARRHPV
jgi:hypothetical protein